MLNPAEMLSVRIIILERDADRVARALGAVGAVHLKSSVDEAGGELQPEELGGKIKQCSELTVRLGRLADVHQVQRRAGQAGASDQTAEADKIEEFVASLERSLAPDIEAVHKAEEALSET